MNTNQIPQQKELENAVSDLQVFMDITAVTLHESDTGGKSGYVLTIILEEESNQNACEMYQWADKIFKKHLVITYRIINIWDVLHQLKHGNLYYIKWYLGSIYLFRNEEFNFKIKQILKARELIKKTINKNTGLIAKAEELRRGAQHYAGTNSHQLALYTIVQTINLLFGIIGELVMGKRNSKMHIIDHLNIIKGFAPVLNRFFNSSNKQDIEIMELLDGAYRDFPYYGKTKIKKESISIAQKKLQGILKEAKKIYKEQLSYCEEKLLTFKDPESIQSVSETLPITDKTLIANIITHYIKTAAVYCFGKRESTTTHFYLLVLEEEHKENAVHDLADIIKSKTKGKCTATLLIHNYLELENASADQKYFFRNAICDGECFYQNQQIQLPHFEVTPKRNFESAREYLQCRNIIVNNMEGWQDNYEWACYSPLKGVMLRQVIEQMWLGMIRLFMGYSPNHFSLAYLLEICEYFDPQAGSFFPRQTKEDIALFRLLSSSHWTLRYSGTDQFSDRDMDLLGERYCDFAHHCKELVTNELERIEN